MLVVVICLSATLFSCGSNELDVADKFLNALYDGDIKKVVSLSSETLIEKSGAQTEKIYKKKMEEMHETLVESYKDKYGKKWKYKIEIIDSYDWEPDEYYLQQYVGDEFKKVEAEIEHTGKGFFNDKEGDEKITLIMEKVDGKWLVASFS